jgi:predicted enzyme related to lactoylglutathione lyase
MATKAKSRAKAKKAPVKKAAPKKRAKASPKKAAPRAAAPQRPAFPAVVHWEVQAKDPGRQQQFFADLFGWKIDANNEMGYGMVPSGGRDAINGGIGGAPSGESRVTVYVQVPDISQALARAETLGATTVMPRTDIGMVVMGQFLDPEGNVIGLVED